MTIFMIVLNHSWLWTYVNFKIKHNNVFLKSDKKWGDHGHVTPFWYSLLWLGTVGFPWTGTWMINLHIVGWIDSDLLVLGAWIDELFGDCHMFDLKIMFLMVCRRDCSEAVTWWQSGQGIWLQRWAVGFGELIIVSSGAGSGNPDSPAQILGDPFWNSSPWHFGHGNSVHWCPLSGKVLIGSTMGLTIIGTPALARELSRTSFWNWPSVTSRYSGCGFCIRSEITRCLKISSWSTSAVDIAGAELRPGWPSGQGSQLQLIINSAGAGFGNPGPLALILWTPSTAFWNWSPWHFGHGNSVHRCSRSGIVLTGSTMGLKIISTPALALELSRTPVWSCASLTFWKSGHEFCTPSEITRCLEMSLWSTSAVDIAGAELRPGWSSGHGNRLQQWRAVGSGKLLDVGMIALGNAPAAAWWSTPFWNWSVWYRGHGITNVGQRWLGSGKINVIIVENFTRCSSVKPAASWNPTTFWGMITWSSWEWHLGHENCLQV